MQNRSLAVNVFDEGNSSSQTNQGTTPQQDTRPTQPETKTPSSTEKEGNTTTTQTTIAQDDGPNLLITAGPWIAASLAVIVILIALLAILRKVNKK